MVLCELIRENLKEKEKVPLVKVLLMSSRLLYCDQKFYVIDPDMKQFDERLICQVDPQEDGLYTMHYVVLVTHHYVVLAHHVVVLVNITRIALHVPFPLTGAKDPLLWSGTESDPHVSKPTFRVESEKVCLRDLNRPSSLSKTTFVSGQAKSWPKRLGFGGP
jgi:ABC-type nitrate/sulfonate/bicarbonate transport system ATPase subunit